MYLCVLQLFLCEDILGCLKVYDYITHIKQIVTLLWNNCIFFLFLAVVMIEPTPQACKANSVPLSYVLFFFIFVFAFNLFSHKSKFIA